MTQIFLKSIESNFDALACTNSDIIDNAITVFQAKCLLMRSIGVSVGTRDIVKYLEDMEGSLEPDDRSGKSAPVVPQLMPLQPIQGDIREEGNEQRHCEGVSHVHLNDKNKCDVSNTSFNTGIIGPSAPTGYLYLQQFSVLLSYIKRKHGITFATMASKVYGVFDPSRRGFVESRGLAQALQAVEKPILSSKAPLYFSTCDELEIGRMSTTQAMSVLKLGASELTF